ncbi:hypothetical protein [Larkinella terrae]|uniref:Uncharacterized protein n=1 Tax=Larkinella terrae TaxID=2025311 RepID=A0A7K0EJ41_9BACT|nr:hypothetical protein [Larkinella terrae]MRS61775.1 hypothetical protein [Larkinella terrae]
MYIVLQLIDRKGYEIERFGAKELYSRAAFQQLESKMLDRYGVGVWPGLKGIGNIEVAEGDVLHACDSLVNTVWQTDTVKYAILKKSLRDILEHPEPKDPDAVVEFNQLAFFRDTLGWCLMTDILIVPE